jgi:hypothetical protein
MGDTGDKAFVPALGQAMQEAEGLEDWYAVMPLGLWGRLEEAKRSKFWKPRGIGRRLNYREIGQSITWKNKRL